MDKIFGIDKRDKGIKWFTIFGLITGIITIPLMILSVSLTTRGFGLESLQIPIPGLVFGVPLIIFLADRNKGKLVLRIVIASTIAIASYYIAVQAFLWTQTILSPNGPAYSFGVYRLAMTFAGGIGACLLGIATMIAGIKLSFKKFAIIVLGGILAALLTPGKYHDWISILPNLYILYPLWQSVVGGVIGYVIQNPKVPNV